MFSMVFLFREIITYHFLSWVIEEGATKERIIMIDTRRSPDKNFTKRKSKKINGIFFFSLSWFFNFKFIYIFHVFSVVVSLSRSFEGASLASRFPSCDATTKMGWFLMTGKKRSNY